MLKNLKKNTEFRYSEKKSPGKKPPNKFTEKNSLNGTYYKSV